MVGGGEWRGSMPEVCLMEVVVGWDFAYGRAAFRIVGLEMSVAGDQASLC